MKIPTKKNYYHLVPFMYKNKLYGCSPYFECSSDTKIITIIMGVL